MASVLTESSRDIVVFGGSTGSLAAVRAALAPLAADFPASIFCVRHLAPDSLPISDLLQGSVAIDANMAADGIVPRRGAAYFAPADRHLLLELGTMRVVRGPRENGLRPSIDVLFRSAAATHRGRVIGVLLSGTQADGVNGLSAVKRCGGVTIVQDPRDAASAELPERALRDVGADHIVQAKDIADLLEQVCRESAPPAPPVPLDVAFEARAAAAAMDTPEEFGPELGTALHITCPGCDGPAWKMHEGGSPELRCEVGHGSAMDSPLTAHSRSLERALWIAFRTLKERGLQINDMAINARAHGHRAMAASYEQRRAELEEHAAAIRGVLNSGWSENPVASVESGQEDRITNLELPGGKRRA